MAIGYGLATLFIALVTLLRWLLARHPEWAWAVRFGSRGAAGCGRSDGWGELGGAGGVARYRGRLGWCGGQRGRGGAGAAEAAVTGDARGRSRPAEPSYRWLPDTLDATGIASHAAH